MKVSKVYDFMNVTTYLHTKNSVDKTRVNSGITRNLTIELGSSRVCDLSFRVISSEYSAYQNTSSFFKSSIYE